MKYISSDTNIWLDFETISRIDLPFRLPCTYIMYREALEEEVISPPNLLEKLMNKGLEAVELTTEEFFYAAECVEKYVKISRYDSTALAIAKHRGIPLLTGDNALRKAAIKEGVEVIGSIGVIDKLYEGNYINTPEYKYCLEQLLEHKERRLPEEEIKKRLEALK